MSQTPYQTLVETLMAAPPERPFITMWENEDDIQSVTFGDFLELRNVRPSTSKDAGYSATTELF